MLGMLGRWIDRWIDVWGFVEYDRTVFGNDLAEDYHTSSFYIAVELKNVRLAV